MRSYGCELDVISQEDGDSTALMYSARFQAASEAIAVVVETLVGQMGSLMPRDDCRAVAMSRDDGSEVFGYGLFKKRRL